MKPFTNSDHELLRENMINFFQNKIKPMVENAEENETTPLELFHLIGEHGYLCPSVSEEYGGVNGDTLLSTIISEELGKINSGFSSAIMVHSGIATNAIRLLGTEEQKKKYLPEAVKGNKIHAFALTEANVGSDASEIETTAYKTDSGDYVIRGTKMWITNGGIADRILVAARVKDGSQDLGISLFIVEKEMPGFQVGKNLKKLGHKSSVTTELIFDDVEVNKSFLIGEEGKGLKSLFHSLTTGRIIVGARAVGVADAAFNYALKYANEREQFGKKIGEFQSIRNKLVDMDTEIDAARMLVYKAAWLCDQGESYIKEAAAAKYYASEVCDRVTRQAIQVFGGYGYSTEYPVERLFRDAKLHSIVEGTSEIQQLIIGREIGL